MTEPDENRQAGIGSLAALLSIVEWSKGTPPWQRDALRRLYQAGELTEADLDELLVLCKLANGVPVNGSVVPHFEPLEEGHVPSLDAGRRAVSLKCIRDVAGVNALAEGQTLHFGKDGLTVVYGRNGSGKSGYARILRRACRARGEGKPILPNVYLGGPTRVAAATIEYRVGDQVRSATWRDGQPTDGELSSIIVFDSDCASVHVDGTNEAQYTPAPLEMLRDLAQACRTLKERLTAELGALTAERPASLEEPKCQAETTVGKLINALSSATKVNAVESVAVLSGEQKLRLESLTSDLASDPVRQAEQLRSRGRRLAGLLDLLRELQSALGAKAAEEVRVRIRDHQTTHEAARLAAATIFGDTGLLPGFGSATWLALWNAARRYSESEAYRGRIFPLTETGEWGAARCPLCQQNLDAGAAARFITFEEFVKAAAQKAADAALQALTEARQALRALDLSPRSCRESLARLREDGGSLELTRSVWRFLRMARERRVAILKAADPEQWPSLPDLPALPETALTQTLASLNRRAAALQQPGNATAHTVLRAELQELKDRVWLAEVLDDIKAEIGRLKRTEALEACIKDADTHAISLKSTEVADTLVTVALQRQFARELAESGIGHLNAQLLPDGSRYAVPRFKIGLPVEMDVSIGHVLSEGEHRCIALAAFLSDLATEDRRSAIIFDDPVCSLDQEYREAFAARLAREAKARQVIVFTHDLVFLFQLERVCRDHATPISFVHVCRTPAMVGRCESDPPPKARPANKAIEIIERKAAEARRLYEQGRMDHSRWLEEAKLLLGLLRDTWELAAADALSPVVRRYDDKVWPSRLKEVAVITDDDCRVVDEGYGKSSRQLHGEAQATSSADPTPDEIDELVGQLRVWLEDVRARQARARR